LARSYGLAPASVVPILPHEAPKDPLTTFEGLSGEEQTAFYKAHQSAIIAAQNRRQYGDR